MNIYIPGEWLFMAGALLVIVGSWAAALFLSPKPPQRPRYTLPSQWEQPPVTWWQAVQTPLLVIVFMAFGSWLLLLMFDALGIRL